ncbi:MULTISPECIES: metallophosphoesterase [Sporosarcina]|uniref:metallophosphoesterase n=1 Tax=Sporosarcina TaxID=1569 RepID=UPI00058EECD1|nr:MULTISPECIES: metallophosphoesterase [Sporosarcina]WJY28613.1 metallophosphoesterase family protein [Sporosarcina sp. 0.2-SM1T-5]
MKTWKIAFGVLSACAALVTASMLWSAKRVTVKKHAVEIDPDPDSELTVFFISDVHRRRVPGRLSEKVQQTGKSPDLVIIGGDFAEKGVPVRRVQQNAARLAEMGPVYYVWGNNDREIGEETMRSIIADVGGTILDNRTVPVASHPGWIISGADDPSSGNADLRKAVEFGGQYDFRIVVMHNPSSFGNLADMASPALLAGGHTHGGQIRVGPWGMQPKGTFRVDRRQAELISNGFGTSLVPLRFGAPPETHLITLRYKKGV